MKNRTNSNISVIKFSLQLYVSGMSEKSMIAIEKIKKICNEYLQDCSELEIIDIYKNPESAIQNQVIFSPSLIIRLPLPRKVLIGNLSDTSKIMNALGLRPEVTKDGKGNS